MKTAIFIILTSILGTKLLIAQNNLNGAWKMEKDHQQHLLLIQDEFFFHTVYTKNKFIMSRGGEFKFKDNTINALLLYNNIDSSEINKTINISYSLSSNQLSLKHQKEIENFKRVDSGKAPLAGVWKITGRLSVDGQINPIHQTGTRQTYKLLTGSKFQWVAIDPAKKQFSGTGGGSYIFKDGKYIETIEFFSRDNSRVGASLSFNGELKEGNWHHSGLSSKGDKIYEVWGRIKTNK